MLDPRDAEGLLRDVGPPWQARDADELRAMVLALEIISAQQRQLRQALHQRLTFQPTAAEPQRLTTQGDDGALLRLTRPRSRETPTRDNTPPFASGPPAAGAPSSASGRQAGIPPPQSSPYRRYHGDPAPNAAASAFAPGWYETFQQQLLSLLPKEPVPEVPHDEVPHYQAEQYAWSSAQDEPQVIEAHEVVGEAQQHAWLAQLPRLRAVAPLAITVAVFAVVGVALIRFFSGSSDTATETSGVINRPVFDQSGKSQGRLSRSARADDVTGQSAERRERLAATNFRVAEVAPTPTFAGPARPTPEPPAAGPYVRPSEADARPREWPPRPTTNAVQATGEVQATGDVHQPSKATANADAAAQTPNASFDGVSGPTAEPVGLPGPGAMPSEVANRAPDRAPLPERNRTPRPRLKPSAVAAAIAPSWAPTESPRAGGRYVVSLLQLKDPAEALKLFNELQQRHGDALGGRSAVIRPFTQANGEQWVRVLVMPPGTEEQARGICTQLGVEGEALGCGVVKQ